MSNDYLDQLSRFAAETRLEDLEGSTVAAAKDVVLDTIGAIIAGSRWPENAAFARLAPSIGGGGGRSTVFGHPDPATASFAAMVNATAGVSLEMDEGTRLGGGHPSIHVTPAAFAVAEQQGSSGKALLESIIVGYEVSSRIGGATRGRSEVHSHGTWGTIGAATATARLLGFDPGQTRQTMNLATSMSPANTWTPCLEGATIRNLYPGRSNSQGILAAYLCQCGFTGVEDAPTDVYTNVLGDGFDQEAAVEGLGAPGSYRIQQNYFKLHACCLYQHPALDAVQSLLKKERFAPAEVSAIRVEAPPMALIMNDPEPKNMLAAKFSIPFGVAAALVHGATDITAFYPERVSDPEVLSLARRVTVVADEEMSFRRYDYPSSRVEITLKDGRTFEESVTAQHGDVRNPASREELVGKFTFLSVDTLGEERTQQVVEVVNRLDKLGDVKELTRLLAPV
ncbi:MAG: MmgE/PrpD family protein [Chloroflexi bacterium]|nr:MmgE/PrpD family protein [Chloroflexota bacterium]